MSTKKIFYEDQYVADFHSFVTLCEPADGGMYKIALEATAYYPLGGGQPADVGYIYPDEEGSSVINIVDVREDCGVVLHLADAPVPVGTQVSAHIDWNHRFSLMQQHTGEHIVSGLALKQYGYENIGFHMGDWFTTMDLSGEIDPEGLQEIERLANKAVYENVPVSSRNLSTDELDKMQYRSKKLLAGDVRIITVEGYDSCACCGLHCALTGEIGIIKLVHSHKYKSGMRLYMLCGLRAVNDYYIKNNDIYTLSRLFSAKPEEAVEAAKQCYEENIELRKQITACRFEMLKIKADGVPAGNFIHMFEDGLSPDELRRLCVLLCEKAWVSIIFSSVNDVYRYALGCRGADARTYAEHMNSMLNGRGGGQKNLAQGTLNTTRKEIEEYVDQCQRTWGHSLGRRLG